MNHDKISDDQLAYVNKNLDIVAQYLVESYPNYHNNWQTYPIVIAAHHCGNRQTIDLAYITAHGAATWLLPHGPIVEFIDTYLAAATPILK